MELLYPSYYKNFHCIASDCPDSCCHEWDVQVDPESAARYQNLEGPLGGDLRAALYTEDGEIYLRNENDRCPMWRNDGLCRIQAELGHDALCHTCREFPRLRQDYGTFLELGLEMSCPEATRIMLTANSWHLISETIPGGDEPDYDEEVMDILRRSRPMAFDILQDFRYLPAERLAILLLYGYHVQAEIDGGEPLPFDPDTALAEARQFAGEPDAAAFVDFYRKLEILTARWESALDAAATPNFEEPLCRLAQYGVYRYFYQAVSDFDLVSRVKLVISGCILTAMLGGTVDIIQLYAKEIENSADNVDAILDGAYTTPALTDAHLLGFLLK